jgi:hypothetical protein
MTRSEFETLLRRAGELAQDQDFFLIDSQALRGICSAIPRDFPKTYEADLYPRRNPQAWSILRTQMGKGSRFFKKAGYYLDCADPALSTLPDGWLERLIPYRTPRTGGVTAWCLEPHDLFVAKLVAWREKDILYLRAMLRHGFAKPRIVLERIGDIPFPPRRKEEFVSRLNELLRERRAKRRSGPKKK